MIGTRTHALVDRGRPGTADLQLDWLALKLTLEGLAGRGAFLETLTDAYLRCGLLVMGLPWLPVDPLPELSIPSLQHDRLGKSHARL